MDVPEDGWIRKKKTPGFGKGGGSQGSFTFCMFEWRRDRDSNPRNRKRFNRFRVCRLRPLGHLSVILKPVFYSPHPMTGRSCRHVKADVSALYSAVIEGNPYNLFFPKTQ